MVNRPYGLKKVRNKVATNTFCTRTKDTSRSILITITRCILKKRFGTLADGVNLKLTCVTLRRHLDTYGLNVYVYFEMKFLVSGLKNSNVYQNLKNHILLGLFKM